MKLTALAAPAYDTILPLAECKRHLRVTGTDEDTLIGELRDAAVDWVETYAKHPMDSRSFRLDLDCFASALRFPIGPVTAVTAISYYDGDDVDTALDSADWFLGGEILVAADTWPAVNGDPGGVRITFTAGAANKKLVMAAKLLLGHWFNIRETVGEVTGEVAFATRSLCDAVRMPAL